VINVLREFEKQGLLRNAMALWTVHFFRKALPLITVPFLARVLGSSGWGLAAIFQSLAACIALLIEFGFEFSATRQVARCRQSPEQLADVVAGVFGTQALLAVGAVAATLLLYNHVAVLRDNPALVAISLVLAVADGWQPTWFFIGVERMGVAAGLEIVSKVSFAIGIIALVRSHQDVWIVLALQALSALLSSLAALVIVNRSVPIRLPSVKLVSEAMRIGWPMFVMRSAQNLYTLGNAFLLGLFVSPTLVGYFAGPERITRALAGLLNPIRQTLYPRLSKLLQTSPAEAVRLARLGMIVTSLGGLAMGAVVFLFAPLLVRVALGVHFAPAVGVLRLLAILPPLVSITQSLGAQWLLPLGRERVVIRSVIAAGLLNLVLVFLLVPRYAHIGMAWAVVCSETFVCAMLLYATAADSDNRSPLRRRASLAATDPAGKCGPIAAICPERLESAP
jgi:PST family polysaccharide transporter